MTNWYTPITQPFTGRMIPRYLHGTIPPMPTACNPDHTLDETGIRAMVDFLIEQKIDTLFVRSGVGKMYAFTYDEVKRIIDITIDQVADRCPVIVSTCGVWDGDLAHKPDPALYTRQTVELTQYAGEKGATAAVVALPLALDASPARSIEDTIVEYYRAVSAETELPIVLYRSGAIDRRYWLMPSLLRKLVAIPRIAGVMISIGDMVLFGRNAFATKGTDFGFLAGDERAYGYTMLIGATGVIGRGCNTHPQVLRAVYDRMMARDCESAREATRDSIRAMELPPLMDPAISSLAYARAKGANVKLYTKVPTTMPLAGEIDAFVRAIDSVKAHYMA